MSTPPSSKLPGPDFRRAFIQGQTTLASPSLVPEISLHLAIEVTPLWQATEESLSTTGLPPPYWAFAWPGGQALARMILDRPEIVRGRRVLDLAAGCGLVAIAAARAGAASAGANEIDAFALAAIGLNAAANDVRVELLAGDLLSEPPPPCDLILAGDLCYERPMAERVIAWLSAAANAGTEILLADPGRNYLPKSGLVALAAYDVPTPLDLEDRPVRNTKVYRLPAPCPYLPGGHLAGPHLAGDSGSDTSLPPFQTPGPT